MMKRKHLFVLFILLSALLIAGCRSEDRAALESEVDAARAENEAKAEELAAALPSVPPDTPPGTASGDAPAEETGDALPAAKPEKHGPLTDWDGILSSSYRILENKLCYNLSAEKTIPSRNGKGHNTGALIAHAYTDLASLESFYLCPDPLCTHEDLNTCIYTGWSSSAPFLMADSRTVYMVREDLTGDGRFKVYKADLEKNTAKVVFTPEESLPGIDGPDEGVLYVFTSESVFDPQTRETERKEYMVGISADTDEILFKRLLPEDAHVHLIRYGKLLYSTPKELIRCNADFSDPEVLFSFAGKGGISVWYYDENRDEFWFQVIGTGAMTGHVYRLLADGTVEDVPFYSTLPYFFQLTNTKIYYSLYDPIRLGDHPFDPNGTFDNSGGKIYMADREHPDEEPTLVFDGAGKYFICLPGVYTYSVFGDQLFFAGAKLIDYVDPVTRKKSKVLSIAGDVEMTRIDLKTGEEVIFAFD